MISKRTNESHGSITIANDVAIELARLLMEESGAGRDEDWYRRVIETPDVREQVELPNPIPITVRA